MQTRGIKRSYTRFVITSCIRVGPASPHIIGRQEYDEVQHFATIGSLAETNLDGNYFIGGIDDTYKCLPTAIDRVILEYSGIAQTIVISQLNRPRVYDIAC